MQIAQINARQLALCALFCLLLTGVTAVRPTNPGSVVGASVALGRRPQRFVEQSVVGGTINTVGGILALGEYYANIKVGGQTASVDLDTGSSTLAIPDSHCSNCIKSTGLNPYDASQSNSGKFATIPCSTSSCTSQFCVSNLSPTPPGGTAGFANQCLLDISYGDGSGLGGALASDVVSFPSAQGLTLSAEAVFGRVLNNRGFVTTGSTQAPGILGLAYNNLNCAPFGKYCSNCDSPCFPTPLDRVVEATGMRYMFGLCLTANGGAWDLGYADLNKMTSPIQWVPVAPEADGRRYFWRVDLRTVSQGGTSLNYNPASAERTIVDSGTTLMVVPSGFISALRSLWIQLGLPKASSHFGTNSCCNQVSLTAAQLAAYPDMVFTFANGLSLNLPASQYFLSLGGGFYQLAMSIGSTDIILGDSFMQQFYTVFDTDNNNVGFSVLAANSCDATKPVSASTDGQSNSDSSNTAGIGAGIAVAFVAACAFVGFAYYRKKQNSQASTVSVRSPGYSVVSTSNATTSSNPAPAVPPRSAGQPSGYAARPPGEGYSAVPQVTYKPVVVAPPPFAAHEWKTYNSPEGYVYYFNERTGETTWTKPPGMP